MTSLAYALTVGNEQYAAAPAGNSSSAAVTALTAVDAAITVAEGDGASPTQAHVNAIRSAYTTLATAVNAVPASASGDLVLVIDSTKITTMNKLKAAFDSLYRLLDGSGLAKG